MTETAPPMPRRAFLAAGLATLAAGAIAGLGVLGAATAPRAESFQFVRGTSFATGEEARLRGYLAEAAADDRITVVITGHTGTQGDEQANIALSQDRAALAAELAAEMGIDLTRVRSSGAGGGAPLPKPDDMTERAHQTSLARVDVVLQVRR